MKSKRNYSLMRFGVNIKKDAEDVWKFTQLFVELDDEKKKNGSDLDEFKAHR